MRMNRLFGSWLVTVAALSGAVGTLRAAPSTQPTGEEVVEKGIEASGGKAASEKIKSRIMHGTVTIPARKMDGTVTIYFKYPNLFREEAEITGVEKSEKVYDGHHAWEVSAMRGTRLLTGAELEQFVQQGEAQAQTDWHKLYKSVSNDGIVEFDGKPCYKLSVVTVNGKKQVQYYDKQTSLMVGSEAELEMMGTKMRILSKLSDYQEEAGVKLPHTVATIIMVSGQQIAQDVKFDKIESNVEIPAEKFAMPDDVKKLAENPPTEPADEAKPEK